MTQVIARTVIIEHEPRRYLTHDCDEARVELMVQSAENGDNRARGDAMMADRLVTAEPTVMFRSRPAEEGTQMSVEPIELVAKTTGRVVGFVCGKCHCTDASLLISALWDGSPKEQLASARKAAEEHCGPWFCACGNEKKKHEDECSCCRHRRWAEEHAARELAAYEKAEKVLAEEWTGEYVWSGRFECIYRSVEELVDRYADNEEEPPEYVWECNEVRFTLDASEILAAAAESQEAYDGFMDQISPAAEKELQALLDGWLKKGRDLRWWTAGRTRAVLLPKAGT